MAFHYPEQFRITHGPQAGTFDLGSKSPGRRLFASAEEAGEWEHVVFWVRRGTSRMFAEVREIDFIRRQFWDDTDIVAQFFLGAAFASTGHLWCARGEKMAFPPRALWEQAAWTAS